MAILLLLGSVCLFFSAPAFSYDRAKAVAYARRWSNNYPYDGSSAPLRNDAVYIEPGPEGCTSFTSQCVIAGGMRFRYSYLRGDNIFTGNAMWQLVHSHGMLPEMNTGAYTYPVNPSGLAKYDMKNYSRILGAATDIRSSLISSTHVSVESLPPYANSSSDALLLSADQVEPGDIYTVENSSSVDMIHSGFISNILTTVHFLFDGC